MLSTSKQAQDDPYAQWDALLPRDPIATPAAEEPDFECRICQEPPTDPCVTRCGHLYCLSCLRQWLDFSPKCPTCKTLSSMQDVVPIYRGSSDSSALSSGPSSPEAATSPSSTRSSISFSQRLLSPPPNHLLRPLPDDAQVSPSALFSWSWGKQDDSSPSSSTGAAAHQQRDGSRSWRKQRSAFTTSTSSPASSVFAELAPSTTRSHHHTASLGATNANAPLLAPPPRFRFTLEDPGFDNPTPSIRTPRDHHASPEELQEEEWDTDDEMEFQLNQIASIKVPQTITDAVRGEVYQGQPVRRALSVVGLAIFLTVLLK